MDQHDEPTIIPALERTTHAVALWVEHALRERAITQAEAHILAYLASRPASTINDLHASFGHKRSTLTSILDRLERRGLVRRGAHPTSRRLVSVLLTEEGRRVGDEVRAALHGLEARISARAGSAEVAAFLPVLRAIEGVIEGAIEEELR